MPTIYEEVLGDRMALLPAPLARALSAPGDWSAHGRMCVSRASGTLRNAVATALGIPPAGDYDLQLDVVKRGEALVWTRRFGPHVVRTIQFAYRGLLVERSGPGSIGFELIVRDGALFFEPRRAWAFGLPLPLKMAPHITAENSAIDRDGWHVRVRFSVPGVGWIAGYEGDVISPLPSNLSSRGSAR